MLKNISKEQSRMRLNITVEVKNILTTVLQRNVVLYIHCRYCWRLMLCIAGKTTEEWGGRKRRRENIMWFTDEVMYLQDMRREVGGGGKG